MKVLMQSCFAAARSGHCRQLSMRRMISQYEYLRVSLRIEMSMRKRGLNVFLASLLPNLNWHFVLYYASQESVDEEIQGK